MTVNAVTDTKKGRTGIAPTYLHTTHKMFNDTDHGVAILATANLLVKLTI